MQVRFTPKETKLKLTSPSKVAGLKNPPPPHSRVLKLASAPKVAPVHSRFLTKEA